MASVKKVTVHGNVRWQVRWRSPDGKPGKRNFETAREANAHRAKVENELHSGTYVDQRAGRVTFEEYAEAWRAAQPHRPKTVARVRTELHRHVYPTLGARGVGQVRPSEVQAFITGLPLAPGSVRNVKATLAAIFSAAVRDGLRPSNPCEGVKMPPVIQAEIKPLTLLELSLIVDALPAKYKPVAIVGAGTGLRPGELFGLQKGDVDFLGKEVRVDRQVLRHGVAPLKNRSAYRTVPVGDMVITALAPLTSPQRPKDDFMFRGPTGGHVVRDTFDDVWSDACVRAGLPGVRTHDLRHFYASALIRSGLNPKVVAKRLGHKNAAMTLNVYSHLWADDQDRTREAIDGLFGKEQRRGA